MESLGKSFKLSINGDEIRYIYWYRIGIFLIDDSAGDNKSTWTELLHWEADTHHEMKCVL